MMKKTAILLLFGILAVLRGSEYLYTIEITPANLADIDIHQSVAIKEADGKKAILVSKSYHTWLDLIPEKCFGNEITVTFRYKAAKKGVYPKKASARLRYAEGDIYYKGPTGKPIVLTPSDEWKTASCTMKFPAKLEQAMIVFSTGGADYYVTDMKVSKKNKKQKQTQAQTRSLK